MKKFDKKGPKRSRTDEPRSGGARSGAPRTGAPRTGGARTGGARARPESGFDRRGAAPAPYERRRPAGGGFEKREGTRRPAGGGYEPRSGRRPASGGFEARADRPPARRFGPRTPDAAPPAEAADNESLRDPYQRAQRPRSAGFTVTLDPDVARVFRGDASVNKALRLVIQLMEVAAPRPRGAGAPPGERAAFRPPGGGYRGSAEARGFERKPRFEEDDDE